MIESCKESSGELELVEIGTAELSAYTKCGEREVPGGKWSEISDLHLLLTIY